MALREKRFNKSIFANDSLLQLIFRTVGLDCAGRSKTDQTKFRYLSFIAGTLLVGSVSPVATYGLVLEAHSRNTTWMPTTTSIVVTSCHFASLMLTSIIAVALAGLNFKDVGLMYNKMDRVRESLPKIKHHFKINLFILFAFVFLIGFFALDYIVCSKVNTLYNWYTPLYIFETILFLLEAQVFLLAHKIKKLFETLNDQIVKTLQVCTKQPVGNITTIESPSCKYKHYKKITAL